MQKVECYYPNIFIKLVLLLIIVMNFIPILSIFSKSNSIKILWIYEVICNIPLFTALLALRMFRVTVEKDEIIVRKWYGRKVKMKMSDISKIVVIPANLQGYDNRRIRIYKKKRRIVTMEATYENYDEAIDIIYENVDPSIVQQLY